MASVRSKSTGPEMAVRRFLHASGFRYRLHDRSLPGSPDLVLKKHRAVIFVHGCFWHQHAGCKMSRKPKTNQAYWENKFRRNIERDQLAIDRLNEMGWNVLVVWECEISPERLNELAREILEKSPAVRSRNQG